MALQFKTTGRVSVSIAALMIGASATAALAGGFQIKEQSALGQGSSFAGYGAADALSAMFVNPAAVTSLSGTNVDSSITAILPSATLTDHGSTIMIPGVAGGAPLPAAATTGAATSTDIGRNGYVPALYINHQFTNYDPRMFIGLSVNSAFGLATEPDRRWVGSPVGDSTKLFSINFNPVIGYKFSDQLSVAAGPAFEFVHGVLKFATALPSNPSSFFDGEDTALGFTAGLTYAPAPGTKIGLGWRSAITHELDGTVATNGNVVPAASGGAVVNPLLNTGIRSRVELRLPDIVNFSVQQAIAPNLKALGSVEWTNWSRLHDLTINSTGSGYAVVPFVGPHASGQTLGIISAPWDDGWFFSAGLEYAVNSQFTVRGGGAYEISPIRSATARIVPLPDADRVWASGGFSYNVSKSMTVDFGYSHLFVDQSQIDRYSLPSAGNPITHLVANVDANIDIVTLGVRMKLGN